MLSVEQHALRENITRQAGARALRGAPNASDKQYSAKITLLEHVS